MGRKIPTHSKPKGKKLRTEAEVNEILSKTAKGTASGLARLAADMMHNNVRTRLYDAYQPKKYERTYDFINAITVKPSKAIYGKSRYQSVVAIDPEKMRLTPGTSNSWGQHMSMPNKKSGTPSQDFRKPLIDIIENGSSGGLHPRSGIHFISDAMNWMSGNIQSEAIKIATKGYRSKWVDSEEEEQGEDIVGGLRIRVKK